MAWVSFCISTYNRPKLLHQQIGLLLEQTFKDFEIVISDNDPNASASTIAASFNDVRIKYYHNVDNLGMIKSFNKSIDRATTDYIVMVTDDDPIEKTFLSFMYNICQTYPGFSLYGGFERTNTAPFFVEIIEPKNFISEILNWNKTPNLLWSSCIIEKATAIKIGKIPNYGSPHLADHAFLALAGNEKGGIFVNKMFSTLSSHDSNFSKLNLDYYYSGCLGFYQTMMASIQLDNNREIKKKIICFHIQKWFMECVFNLKKYYTLNKPDKNNLKIIDDFSEKIMSLGILKNIRYFYFLKQTIFIPKMMILKLLTKR